MRKELYFGWWYMLEIQNCASWFCVEETYFIFFWNVILFLYSYLILWFTHINSRILRKITKTSIFIQPIQIHTYCTLNHFMFRIHGFTAILGPKYGYWFLHFSGLFCNHYFLRMLAMIGHGCYDAAYDTGVFFTHLIYWLKQCCFCWNEA